MKSRIILDLTHMKEGVESPAKLFKHLLALTNDYITTSDIMRRKYGVLCRVEPSEEDRG